MLRALAAAAALATLAACTGGSSSPGNTGSTGSTGFTGSTGSTGAVDLCPGVTCSGHGTCATVAGAARCACDPGYVRQDGTTCVPSQVPSLGGCTLFPANHLFNTPIDDLPALAPAVTQAYLDTIATRNGVRRQRNLHLDLGQTLDMTSDSYWGIPYNVVHGDAFTWATVRFRSSDPSMTWDARSESDCADTASGGAHTVVRPCTAAAAPHPVLPIPAQVAVEGGIVTDPGQPYGDHHILLVDADTCRLWEVYHAYPSSQGGWDVYGAATFDLGSNALRPDGWTSSDAAGFPILPLLLRADEASSGVIRHALRFTIETDTIREAYVWPARHLTSNGTDSLAQPPMGQLFRLKASYAIPASFNTQAKAILQALKTYGMYLADGGSDWYIQGEPSPDWLDDTISQVQSVNGDQFEAVDLAPIMARQGFDPDSAAVPPP